MDNFEEYIRQGEPDKAEKAIVWKNEVDVAIIGAGMSGLSAAVYSRLSGLSVKVFEQHYLPGGLCTTWKRSGYTFDYCIDYFMGSKKEQGFYNIWKTLGVIDKTQFKHVDSFGIYKGIDNQVLNLYTDHQLLEKELLRISPEDRKQIKEWCSAIRSAQNFSMIEFTPTVQGIYQVIKSLPTLLTMRKWACISSREWCSRLKSSFLREAIPTLLGFSDVPMSGPIVVFGMLNRGYAAYPLGGSLPIALAAEEKAKALGAEIQYRSKVKRVLIENNKAVGIELEDGRVQYAKNVVAACDANFVFNTLLDGKVKNSDYEYLFQKKEIHPGIVQVSIGVKLKDEWNLSSMPKRINLPLSNPVIINSERHDRLSVYQYSNDPKMAKEGCTVLVVQYASEYTEWKKIHSDKERYRAEKKRILSDTLYRLAEHFDGIIDQVEASDVATPISCERYTGSWHGSTQGWILTTEWMAKALAGFRLPKTFDAVKNFYIIGQWTEIGGGLPPSIRNGRDLARMIKKKTGKLA